MTVDKTYLAKLLYMLDRGRREEALHYLLGGIARFPNEPELWYWLAVLYRERNDLVLARSALMECLKFIGDDEDGLNSVGLEFLELSDIERAEECFQRALSIRPSYPLALSNLAKIKFDKKMLDEARDLLERAVKVAPYHADLWLNLANVLNADGSLPLAELAFNAAEKALSLGLESKGALDAMAKSASRLKRCSVTVSVLQKYMKMFPDDKEYVGRLLHAKMLCADWDGVSELWEKVVLGVLDGRNMMDPFGFIGLSEDPYLSHKNAVIYSRGSYLPVKTLGVAPCGVASKIRLGFMSGEFRQQATSILIVELLESINREMFEIFIFDNSWSDGSEVRHRIESIAAEWITIRGLSDSDAALQIVHRKINILLNLNGFFGRARTGIFAMRPAPVQVNFLGFPGTMGASFMDYIVADKVVIPESEESAYVEKIAYVDGCYQPNDSKRNISPSSVDRQSFSLPIHGFVFCSFNNTYKITPQQFAVWMRILSRVDHSVLWLIADSGNVITNLRGHARSYGIDPQRLIFASRAEPDLHLKRHSLADLFLDTYPYNAHTTASDALWAGLPVLTCLGSTFPGRVAASLLKQLQLEGLITENLQAYEDLAVELALNPRRLSEIKQKLAVQRNQSDLFDGRAYARKLESLFVQMYEKSCSGKPPEVIFSTSS
jgi:predicted O-linked N-acetylglucosamine transferase (SPINDLY family)